MPKLVIMRGLQASGKTTHAEAWVAEDPTERARVNRDSLRRMMHANVYAGEPTERQIVAVRDATINALLSEGIDVVCDDTNLKIGVVQDLMMLARAAGATWQIIDLSHVRLETCIARDKNRDSGVGASVITRTWNDLLVGQTYPLPVPELPNDAGMLAHQVRNVVGLPRAVLVDVDGTLALKGDRSPWDEDTVENDLPNVPVVQTLRALCADDPELHVIVLSGRTSGCQDATEAWLRKHVKMPYDALHMRAPKDTRQDAVVKLEIFVNKIVNHYDVVLVLDDRTQVVKMWRRIGLPVFQVAEGNF